eukprot:3769153-Rhodomonas_salina.2
MVLCYVLHWPGVWCFATSGTEIAHGPTRYLYLNLDQNSFSGTLAAYARATRCPKLCCYKTRELSRYAESCYPPGSTLHTPYAMSGTGIAYGATCLRALCHTQY